MNASSDCLIFSQWIPHRAHSCTCATRSFNDDPKCHRNELGVSFLLASGQVNRILFVSAPCLSHTPQRGNSLAGWHKLLDEAVCDAKALEAVKAFEGTAGKSTGWLPFFRVMMQRGYFQEPMKGVCTFLSHFFRSIQRSSFHGTLLAVLCFG